MRYKNKFLNIIKNISKKFVVRNYNYTMKDRMDFDKDKPFDERYYIARPAPKKFAGEDLSIKITDHDKLFKLKSSETSNIFKLNSKSKNKNDWIDNNRGLNKDKYFYHGAESTSWYSDTNMQDTRGERTLVELEPKTLHNIFEDVVSIKKEFDTTIKCFKNEKNKSDNLLELFFVMNNIQVLTKKLLDLNNKHTDSNDDEHNCYCDDDNYYESLSEIKLKEDITIQKNSMEEDIEREKIWAEEKYINNQLTNLEKRKRKLINKIKTNQIYLYEGGYEETIDEHEINVERLINNYNDKH